MFIRLIPTWDKDNKQIIFNNLWKNRIICIYLQINCTNNGEKI